MKRNKYKKIQIGFILSLLTLGLGMLISSPKAVAATAAICYDPVAKTSQQVTLDSEKQACTSQGYVLVQEGQAVPVAICVDPVAKTFQTVADASAQSGCTNMGFTLVAAGQPMPSLDVATTPQGGSATPNDADAILQGKASRNRGACNLQDCLTNNPLVVLTRGAINFLSVGVGVIVVIMIIIGGIQYSAAGGNPQAVQAAKSKIANAIIALVAYIFLFAFLQWVVPGGIIR